MRLAPFKPNQPLACNPYNPVALLSLYSVSARKIAEAGKDGLLFAKIEAGQFDMLIGLAAEYHHGMDVARENVLFFRLEFLCRMMCEGEGAGLHVFFVDLDIEIIAEAVGQAVVVSKYDLHFHLFVVFTPFAELIPFVIYVAMEEIADEDDLFHIMALHQLVETHEILHHRLRRNSDAGLTEMQDLADVEITDEQGLLLLPEKGLLGREFEMVVFYGNIQCDRLLFYLSVILNSCPGAAERVKNLSTSKK